MILTAPLLLSHPGKSKPIGSSALVIRSGLIIDIGSAKTLIKKHPSHQVCSFKNAVLMPGLVNAHAHLELPLLLNDIRARTLPDWVLNLLRAKKKLRIKDYAEQEFLPTPPILQQPASCGT